MIEIDESWWLSTFDKLEGGKECQVRVNTPILDNGGVGVLTPAGSSDSQQSDYYWLKCSGSISHSNAPRSHIRRNG